MRVATALLMLAGLVAAGEFERIGQQALLDFNQQRFSAALRGFQELKKLQPRNHEIFIAIAQTHQAMGNVQAALDELQAAVAAIGHLHPQVWEVYLKIGDLLKGAGDFTQALRAYDAALEVSPNQASVFQQRGVLNQELDAYEQAEKGSPGFLLSNFKPWSGWSGLGIAWMYLEHVLPDGKPEEYDSYDEGSIFALRRVMELQPKDMVTLSNLVMAENRVCDWSLRDVHLKAMKQALRERASRKENFAPPFHAIEFGYSPKELLVNSKWAAAGVNIVCYALSSDDSSKESEDDIILASFNQLYKIEPKIFNVWMEVMRQVPKSKLWLLKFSKAASKYLLKEAAAAGVKEDRLVFHSKFPKDIELLAKSHADLFLDTPLFNAHTTGGDVLWAGIPMLSLPGENFAQRVAGGLIRSVRMSNVSLVRNLDDYAHVATKLCRKTKEMREMKRLLGRERERLPLFATSLLTSHVETSMKMMWEVHACGSKPRHIIVAERF
ncbi:hypothetical protein GUITHDRAFT_162478 [Guillardia theta CCMP2712]|uniref:protein O-GlcNAc transferase n=1 Tax=Guillardia theta (strain CCMP2712) TaxID=905079 RepID=L1JJA1_GUITC|nr:hypothetical protein GUITHDRAFT_162478 [Guillardia theta CCMP2712]EKX48377.1 hypothetical protein GUITHDRAFT_162478 [Guillardia theta CCMP2712]|eukprot:XP_005835357.1 hypothetical protein GUITHDRAFT_162478 [Guillardia theta CCMP2712]